MKNKYSQLILSIVKSPSFIIFLISITILTVQIVFIGKYRPFNSDDLYWQQVVRTWKPFNGETLYFGTKDIFIEQVPFFYLMESLFSASRRLLIFETVVLTVSAFSLAYLSTIYFLKKLKLKITYTVLLPFIWLASFGYPLVQNYLNSCWRTFEIGLSFATFVFVAAILNGDFKPLRSIWTKLLSLLGVVFIGIVIYSDPYYIFFTIIPTLLFVATLYLIKKINKNTLLIILAGTFLSFVFAKITEIVSEKAGAKIVFDTPSVFVNFNDILTNVVSSLHGLLIVYGADFFGKPAFKITTILLAINALILVIIIYISFSMRKYLNKKNLSKLSLPMLWSLFFAGMLVFTFIVYTVTTLVTVNNYRFFLILIYCSITLLCIAIGLSNSIFFRRIIIVFLLAATAANLGTTLFTKNVIQQGDVKNNISNSLNFTIIKTLQSENLTKGYASYWQANVNTYLSNGKLIVLPSLCENGATKHFKWLIEGGLYKAAAESSFYLIDPDIPAPPVCTKEEIIAQFGAPIKVIYIENKSILIYDYDISTKIL